MLINQSRLRRTLKRFMNGASCLYHYNQETNPNDIWSTIESAPPNLIGCCLSWAQQWSSPYSFSLTSWQRSCLPDNNSSMSKWQCFCVESSPYQFWLKTRSCPALRTLDQAFCSLTGRVNVPDQSWSTYKILTTALLFLENMEVKFWGGNKGHKEKQLNPMLGRR